MTPSLSALPLNVSFSLAMQDVRWQETTRAVLCSFRCTRARGGKGRGAKSRRERDAMPPVSDQAPEGEEGGGTPEINVRGQKQEQSPR